MARLLGALGRLGGGEKKRPSSMQPLKSGETLESKLGGGEAVKPAASDQALAGKPLPKAPGAPQAKVHSARATLSMRSDRGHR